MRKELLSTSLFNYKNKFYVIFDFNNNIVTWWNIFWTKKSQPFFYLFIIWLQLAKQLLHQSIKMKMNSADIQTVIKFEFVLVTNKTNINCYGSYVIFAFWQKILFISRQNFFSRISYNFSPLVRSKPLSISFTLYHKGYCSCDDITIWKK